MLERVEQLSIDVSNIIIYANSAILQNILKNKIRDRFAIGKYMTKYADSGSTLKQAKNETFMPPFGGGTWLVDVQCDKINLGDLVKHLNQITTGSLTVYWTSNYLQFKRLCESDVVKKQGIYCFTMYAGRLYPEDISYIHQNMLPEGSRLPKELLDYLKKNYTYDVNSVCKLFELVLQGETVKTTKDIINKVGMGGNTVDSFVIKLLTSNPKTEKGLKKSVENMIALLEDLAVTYEYNTIRNFMRVTLNTILEIKQLQVMGRYTRTIQNIPDERFNRDKINRLRRFEFVILNDINIARVLKLKLIMDGFTRYDSQIVLLEIISTYLSSIMNSNINNPESRETLGGKRRRKF